jgi:AcrR family transcriptional regulator
MVPSKPRERILATATALFDEEGISAVGVNRIIAEADVAPMTLYRQFGNKNELVAATIEQWSTRWLHMLTDRLERHGDHAAARYAALWDALEAWFASGDFRGSFVLNAAAELRSEPGHPAHAVIAMHRQALFDLLRDLADAAGVANPASLAAQVQVLVECAVTGAVVDREPTVARTGRTLTRLVLANGGRG